MKIVVINGFPGAGKDEFVNCCKKLIGEPYVGNISTVDFVKYIATECGWDGTKTPENRAFLSDLKDLLTEWNDIPFKKIEKALSIYETEWLTYGVLEKGIIFIHCREPKEIQKLCTRLGAIAIFINRKEAKEKSQSNHADAEVENFRYDYYINNNGTINDLMKEAEKFLINLKILKK